MQVPEPWTIDDQLGEIAAWIETDPDDFTRELVWDFFFNKLQVNPLGFPRAIVHGDETEYTVTVPGTNVAVSYIVYRPPMDDERLVVITRMSKQL